MADAFEFAQKANGLAETGLLPGGQIGLGWIARDDHARALAKAGQKHLHLHGGGVLRLIEQDARAGQRAPAHEGQRRHFDHARRHASLHRAAIHEIIERVIDGPQIGVDLLAHVAGQEAEPLARLHRRARQDQTLHHALFEQGDRMAHRQPGLARAGRALGEDQFVLLEQAQIKILRRVARAHHAAFAGAHMFEDAARRLRSLVLGKERAL